MMRYRLLLVNCCWAMLDVLKCNCLEIIKLFGVYSWNPHSAKRGPSLTVCPLTSLWSLLDILWCVCCVCALHAHPPPSNKETQTSKYDSKSYKGKLTFFNFYNFLIFLWKISEHDLVFWDIFLWVRKSKYYSNYFR